MKTFLKYCSTDVRELAIANSIKWEYKKEEEKKRKREREICHVRRFFW